MASVMVLAFSEEQVAAQMCFELEKSRSTNTEAPGMAK
jgi:hypothetical protein